MNYTRTFLTVLTLSALTACGGSSEGDSPEAEAPVPVAAPTPTENDDGATATGAADIAVPEGFDFSTNKTLPILVSMNSSFPSKMYLTICHPLPGTSGSATEPDLNKCLTRTPVTDGQYEGGTLLPNDVSALTATLWSYEPAGALRTYTWSRTDGQLGEWVIAE